MKSFLMKALGVAVFAVAAATSLSCNVNEYCIGCATGDGGTGDGNDGGDGDAVDAPDGDAPDASTCVPTGIEVCDNKDNDCDNNVDEGSLPTIGEACSSPPAVNSGQGECAGGVKQCSPQGTVVCSKPPAPELCDLKDNNCNGLTDEGDPGGGALCGTNTGECTAGVNRCISGAISCEGDIGTVGGQAEICNNRDDDCDGMFDEMVPTGGPCTTGTDVGLCDRGTLSCLGGIETCVGQIGPTFELCDNFDQDCDGNNANGYNLMTDVQNCGACGNVCNLPNAFEGCGPPTPNTPAGTCGILACAPNFFNNNGMNGDGCEFNCGHPFLGAETCNGIDDDCDGLVDMADPSMVAPTGLCDADGACSTMTTLFCGPPPNNPAGTITWRCNYANPNVSTDAAGNLIPETRCDSDILLGAQAVFADNDCDGRVDEAQEPNLGNLCTNGMQGVCGSSGTFVCNTTNRDLAAVCNAPAGGTMTAEICDGLDNNCNGTIDDGASTGNLTGQDWVTIPRSTVQIMKYEASRPDALLGNQLETHACSTTGRLPWTNVTYDQAEVACGNINARLCTEAEWQQMCTPSATYPVTGPATTGTTDFVFIEAEDAFANTTIGGAAQAWTQISPATFAGVTAMQVPDNGFAATAANALTQSSRLDFRLNLLGATNYRIWTRMRAPGVTADPFRVHTAPVVGTSANTNAATQVGDLVIVTTWTRGTNGVPGHTLQGGFTEILTQQHNDGNLDGRLSVAYRVATAAGTVANQAYVASTGTSYTGLTVLKVGNFNTANILFASNNDTGDGNAPNPPDAGTLVVSSAVLAIGAWHLGGNTVAVGPPTSYTELWEIAGSNNGELSMASRILAAGGDPNPGAFTDDVNSNGVAAATISIGLSTGGANNSIWTGLAAGTTAGAANAGDVIVPGVDQWVWVVSPQLTSGAAGTHTFSIYTREDGVIVDTIAVSRQNTTSPTFDNSWAYESNPRTAQPQICNGDELDTNGVLAGDQDDIRTTGSLGMCYANQTGANDAFDMSGNVKEWTAARTSGQNPLRGGASNNLVTGLTCGLNFTLADDAFFFPNAGFRCCR